MRNKNVEIVKGYKGFDKNLCCRGFQYEIGKTYETDRTVGLCQWGFHFCRKLFDVNNYYSFNNCDNRFCEVEAIGEIKDGDNKSVTNKIKIVREISKEEFMSLINIGKDNSGVCNTGDCNTGDWNTGNRNTGDWNTGDWNTGDCNTGDWNTGDCNTGDCNTGDWNTGNRNTGDWNTGDWNTGNRNTGDCNTGDWNKTSRSSGVFCTQEPKLILFNKETDMTFEEWRNTRAYDLLRYVKKSVWVYAYEMTEEEKQKYPNYERCDGYLKEIPRKEASKEWWDNLNKYDKNEIFTLPNFDLKIFNKIMELKITKKEYLEVIKNVNL